MAIFDQRGQKVNYQYNAAGNINFGVVQTREAFADELEKLKSEVQEAQKAKIIDDDTATDVEYKLTKASQQARKETPNKKTILEYLDGAKKLIEGISAAGGMVASLINAAELAQKLF